MVNIFHDFGKDFFVQCLLKGCDTGFGHLLAKRLAQTGYHVYACCLSYTSEGANHLRHEFPKDITIIPLDVTKDESVLKARKLVESSINNRGLN